MAVRISVFLWKKSSITFNRKANMGDMFNETRQDKHIHKKIETILTSMKSLHDRLKILKCCESFEYRTIVFEFLSFFLIFSQ